MKDPASITRRINAIKRLARIYFLLPKGALIEKYAERLRVFDVRGSVHPEHPHKAVRLYITRRALKHIIESRKEELIKHHNESEALELIEFALEHARETIVNFDKYEYEPPTHYYLKDYAKEGRPVVRIALDMQAGELEIKSMHFKKRT